jgi:hypothetical protein
MNTHIGAYMRVCVHIYMSAASEYIFFTLGNDFVS